MPGRSNELPERPWRADLGWAAASLAWCAAVPFVIGKTDWVIIAMIPGLACGLVKSARLVGSGRRLFDIAGALLLVALLMMLLLTFLMVRPD